MVSSALEISGLIQLDAGPVMQYYSRLYTIADCRETYVKLIQALIETVGSIPVDKEELNHQVIERQKFSFCQSLTHPL